MKVIALLALLLFPGGGAALVNTARIAGVGSCHYGRYSDGTIAPDPTCTPGALNLAAVADPQSTICVPGYSKKVRPPESWSEPHKLASMPEYGVTDSGRNYGYDHLVAIEDGGAPMDTDNLWPQPHSQSYVKDRIENRLHAKICAGKLTVQQAAQDLEGDWNRGIRYMPDARSRSDSRPRRTLEGLPAADARGPDKAPMPAPVSSDARPQGRGASGELRDRRGWKRGGLLRLVRCESPGRVNLTAFSHREAARVRRRPARLL